MATPSSSATSPSPPMTYLQHTLVTPQPAPTMSVDLLEREQRKKAVQKFLARAEISMVTRALRARLSYASFKATHNIPHVPLRDLEAHTQNHSQAASFSRTIATKRRAGGTNNYYSSSVTQSLHGTGAPNSTLRRSGSGTMAPPTIASSPRASVNGHTHTTPSNSDSGSVNVNPTPSLYASILSLPPSKQARTIHNASDPPVPAPSRPIASPRQRARKPSTRSIAESTRAQAKGRQPANVSRTAGSPNKRKAKRSAADKGKQKQTSTDADVDGDVDMKAAATLTSLLLHHRPSIAGSASSPRSSIDGSDTGSTHSYSHFAQSSARTMTVTNSPARVSADSTSTATDASFRKQTPPPAGPTNAHSTPRPAPTDNEAADLMLFLATSPSPARPSNKDAKDHAAYRALGGGAGALRNKGRVLFPTASGGENQGSNESHPGAMRVGSVLTRGEDSSFTSSISSIGTELGTRSGSDAPIARNTPPSSQLLPPPPFQLLPSASTSPTPQKGIHQSPKPSYAQGAMDFNFSEFINASPSPLRNTTSHAQKANLGLRADVGRKLFEEEQMRHALANVQSPGKRQEEAKERGLGAGIDLNKS